MNQVRTTKTDESSRLYWLAFLLALLLRLILINRAVLTENELELVFQSLQISRGLANTSSLAAAYTGVTGFLFFIFEPSNFLAHFFPAVVGASLVLLPYFWRDALNEKQSVILSFALVFDPLFVLFSRAVNPGILALAALLWGITFLKLRKPILIGFCLAIGILSGAAFWNMLLLTVAGYFLYRSTVKRERSDSDQPSLELDQLWKLKTLFSFLVFTILLSTSLLLDRAGLSGAGQSLALFFSQFKAAYEKPIYHSIYLMLAHSYLPLLGYFLSLSSLKRSEDRKWLRWIGILALLSLIFTVLFNRSSFELLLVPVFLLWIGASKWISLLRFHQQGSKLGWLFIFVFVIAVLSYISQKFSRLAGLPLNNPQFINLLLMTVAGLILLASAWWLLKFAFVDGRANKLMVITIFAFLFFLSLSTTLKGIYSEIIIRSNEFLGNRVYLPNDDVEQYLGDFNSTGRDLAQFGTAELKDLPTQLGWYIREFNIPSPQNSPTLILSRSSELPDSQDDYRGANIVLERSVDWTSKGMETYLRYLFGGKASFIDQKAVLWIKTNLFTGANQ